MFLWVVVIIILIKIVFIFGTVVSFSQDLNMMHSIDVHQDYPTIISLGLPRTATCSTAEALKILGFNVQHLPLSLIDNLELYSKKKNALLDVTMLGYRPADMYRMFPEAKFIYTTRDDETWVKSLKKLQVLLQQFSMIPAVNQVYQNCINTFGLTSETMVQAKKKYEDEIFQLCQEKEIDVPFIDFTNNPEQNWQKLLVAIDFVGTIPKEVFPKVHHITYHIKQAWGY